MERLNVLFFIKRTKKLQNGKCPIYCRLTMKGKRSEFGVNQSVDEEIWIPSAGKAKGNSIEVFRLNKALEKIKQNTNEILRQFELKGIHITPELVKNDLLGISPIIQSRTENERS